jgi:hypothetical protein
MKNLLRSLVILVSFLLVAEKGSAQTNPTPHNLSTNWTLTGWNAGVASGSYPANGATGVNTTTGVVAGATNANMVFHWFASEQTSLPASQAKTLAHLTLKRITKT